jgi:quercetin dioxygenase-like cupin family protein
MAHAGKTISNPISRERITFLQTAQDTNGELLVFDCAVAPGGVRLPTHVHASQREHFVVIAGRLGVALGRKTYTLLPGQRITLPPRIRHQWWNAGDDEVRFRVQVAPAGSLETVLEVNSALAHQGKLDAWGMPKDPFELANLASLSETYIPGLPILFQKAAVAMVSGVGFFLGYNPTLERYLSAPDAADGDTAA